VKILSTLALTSKTQRAVGPFTNSGPIPPKADQESTYTVTWTLSNTTNDLKDGLVTAELPVGVVWKGETAPISERINYSPDTRVISWNVGNISAGAGFNYSPKTASFKVGITPSINQIGAVPTLVTNIRASALDTFANSPVSSTADDASTQFSDPNFKFGDGTVAQ
jgi:hypothetical protein